MSTVFKYINKKTNETIGYHLSTFCQTGPKERAKRYSCETPEAIERQKEIISRNLKSVLEEREESEGISAVIDAMKNQSKEGFEGLSLDDISLEYESV